MVNKLGTGSALFLFSNGQQIEKIYPQRLNGICDANNLPPISVSFGPTLESLRKSREMIDYPAMFVRVDEAGQADNHSE